MHTKSNDNLHLGPGDLCNMPGAGKPVDYTDDLNRFIKLADEYLRTLTPIWDGKKSKPRLRRRQTFAYGHEYLPTHILHLSQDQISRSLYTEVLK